MIELWGAGSILALIIIACIQLSESKYGTAGCLILAIGFIALCMFTCAEVELEEKERKERNERFQQKLRMKDEVWREYASTLPEDYRERRQYLEDGKDFAARIKRDSALRSIEDMFE